MEAGLSSAFKVKVIPKQRESFMCIAGCSDEVAAVFPLVLYINLNLFTVKENVFVCSILCSSCFCIHFMCLCSLQIGA